MVSPLMQGPIVAAVHARASHLDGVLSRQRHPHLAQRPLLGPPLRSKHAHILRGAKGPCMGEARRQPLEEVEDFVEDAQDNFQTTRKAGWGRHAQLNIAASMRRENMLLCIPG